MRRAIFGLGMAQVVVTGLVLTALIHLTLGFSPAASLALGLPLALSSTAQVLPGLKSSGRINSPFGEKAFSILLFQDLAIVPMITRSEERRVGKACVSKGRYRWSTFN